MCSIPLMPSGDVCVWLVQRCDITSGLHTKLLAKCPDARRGGGAGGGRCWSASYLLGLAVDYKMPFVYVRIGTEGGITHINECVIINECVVPTACGDFIEAKVQAFLSRRMSSTVSV